jgi:methionine synthase II (cobalamin-independent)
MPGTDIAEAVRVVLGELPDFPHLPELPARGPGAELIGRTAGLLVDLPVELYAGRWRLAAHPGKDLRRIRDLWEGDLDELTAQAADYAGPFKVQAAGPWTLAAGIELPTGGPVLRDHGATRDLAVSLAEGLRAHVAEVGARLPRAAAVLQLDEPSLPAVLAGRVPTESGFGTLRAVDEPAVIAALRDIVTAVGVPVVVHCCAPDVPVAALRSAGAAALALDLDLVADLDPLGEAIDAGLGLLAGAALSQPPVDGRPPSSADVADRVRKLWRRLGFPAARLPEQVVVTPACGVASAPPEYARAVLAACRDAGRRILDDAHR